jgi:hypothetical protein
MRCAGVYPTEESLKQIKEDFANSRIPVGTCAKCFRKGIIARSKGGQWVLDGHDKPAVYRSGKRSSK